MGRERERGRVVRFSKLTNMALRPLGFELRRLASEEPSRSSSRDERLKRSLDKNLKRSLHFQHLVNLIEDVPGDIVECGVGAGKSLFLLGLLTDGGRHSRRIWAFDSFQGLPAPSPKDEADRLPRIKEGKLGTSEEEVRLRMVSYGTSETKLADRFVFVPGHFPHSFPQYPGGPIAQLHLDVDLYQSYKDCLEWFEPMVVPGGVIAFDEYRNANWPGSTKAIEEYYGGPPPGIQKSSHWNRSFLVKR